MARTDSSRCARGGAAVAEAFSFIGDTGNMSPSLPSAPFLAGKSLGRPRKTPAHDSAPPETARGIHSMAVRARGPRGFALCPSFLPAAAAGCGGAGAVAGHRSQSLCLNGAPGLLARPRLSAPPARRRGPCP